MNLYDSPSISLDAPDDLSLSPERRDLLRALSKRDQSSSSNAAVPALPQTTRLAAAGFFPLSSGQERLWLIHQVQPNTPVYNISLNIELRGVLNVEHLKQALHIVFQSHDMLRARVCMDNNRPVQIIDPVVALDWSQFDLTEWPTEFVAAEANRLETELAQRPFALDKAPLCRVGLVYLAPECHHLILVAHHLIADGQSADLILRDFLKHYEVLESNAVPEPCVPAFSYADYVTHQLEQLNSDAIRAQIAYWHANLARADSADELSLPFDRPRPTVQSFYGDACRLNIPESVTRGLRMLSRRYGVTLQSTVLAAFQTLLHLYSAQRTINVGIPVLGRNRAEFESLVGFFANTLVIQTRFDPAWTFSQVLACVGRSVTQALENQDAPFEKIIESLPRQRDLSKNPLFQVMFAWRSFAANRMTMAQGALSAIRIPVDTTTSKFDLTLTISDVADGSMGLAAEFEYCTALFDRSTIDRMASHFARLLAMVAASPDQPIAWSQLMPDVERAQVLESWNDTQLEVPASAIHQQFETQARAHPNRIAVTCGEGALTYGALNTRANRLARRLQHQGVGPECVVGLCATRGLNMLAGLLAIMKTGGAYLSLDPGLPDDRLAGMIHDAHIAAVLAQPDQLDRMAALDAPRPLVLDDGGDEPEDVPGVHDLDDACVAVDPLNIAYVMYTSGSTGRPKGVQVTHAALTNFIESMKRKLQLTPDDVVAATTTFSFDIAGLELYLPLTLGATISLLTNEEVKDGNRFRARLDDTGVTVLQATPSTWQLLLMSSPSDRAKPQRHFKHVLCGGENLRIDLAKRLAPMGDKAWNLYGPTETTIWSSATQITGDENQITIGTPIHNTQLYICDEDLNLVPPGVTGQILIGGQGLARGYRNQPGQTADRFVPNPFSRIPGDRLYRTGDLGRYRPDGNIVWLGRVDQQVKIRGYRIELEEVERALCEYGSVADAAVVAKGDPSGGSYLAAIMITRPDTLQPSRDDLRQHLLKHLPEYMLPSEYVFVDHMPLTASGKVDRQALRKLDTVYHAAEINRHPDGPAVPIDDGVDNGGGIGDMEELVAHVWREVLGLESVGLDVNFFDVGGHSLRLAQVRSNLESRLHRDIPMIDLFRYPTVRSSAAFLLAHAAPPIDQARRAADPSRQGDAEAASVISNQRAVDHSIAIVGLAGRFPGADSAEQFWDNLGQGVESIRSFGSQSDDVSTLSRDAHHVRAGGVLDDIEAFDAGYFGYSPREASLMDPQHRLFLETAVQALENAGYGDASGRRIAVFAGCSLNTYLLELIKQTDLMEAAGLYAMLVGSDKDFVSTRVSYKLGLRGPAMTVQTACSTSLVAVHLACQSLLNNECEMALAGAASIRVPQTVGYRYEEGGVLSPDGHCRAFDAQAQGTVPGSGVGVVVLKRLDAAMADGDFIHAVIKGSAINNDGANKVSYTAPSVEGQAQVIAEAMTKAGVTADSIGYVEAHGTGTALGDPIEIAALTEAYRHQTDKTGFCRIGSVKTNIGHLDTASGIASLIKTIGIMRRGTIPASLNYVSPNPTIPFETTPFVVNDREMAWPDEARPMRAAVSNFGIGGTNVHIVLEEPPVSQQGALSDKAQTQIQLPVSEQAQWHVVPISAKTPEALDAAISQLAVHLESHNDSSQLKEPLQIEHIAFTYQIGRKSWNHRRAIVCRDKDELLSSLVSSLSGKMIEGDAGKCPAHAEVVFLFPGFGMQYLEMGHGLYQQFTTYRDAVNRCVGAAQPYFSFDIRMALMPRLDGDMSSNKAAEAAADTPLGQLAVFVAEYALAQLWMSLGIKPTALAGHSLGEYVAACIAGVFSLEDAIMLVIKRAELMARTPAGLMLSVALGDAEIQPLVKDTSLSLALVNAPNLCVVAGSHDDVAEFESRLKQMGKAATRLKVAHAYHSSMMDGILDPYREIVNKVTLHPPKVPIMSSHSGAWMTAEEATRREYWVRHARETIRFADAIHTLVSSKAGVMIEVGPGKGMSALVQGQVRRLQKQAAWRVTPSLTSVAGPEEGRNFLEALAQVWAMGMDVDWNGLGRREGVRRIPLPTYPFQRQRYWLAAPSGSSSDLPTVPNAKTAMPDERHTEQRPEHQSDKPVRQTVQAILREILGVADFDGQASFLELGGHSLLAIQVVSRIRDVLRCKLSVRDLLTCATLNDLVQLVEKVMAVDNHTDAIQPVPRDSSTASLPLSVAEQRLHFLEKLENGLATYNVPIAIELTGTLNRFALERALDDLVVRHEILRTTYQDSATGAYRVIADSQAARFNLGWIDLSPLDEDTRQHELRRILVEHANQPFVLANGPLARAQLVCLAENAHVFAMTLHHIIADGWSVNIMVREIVQLYYAQVLGQPTHLPSLSVQYADYAVWQKEYMADPAIESAMQVQLTYWRHELAGSTNLLALPTDRPRPHVQRHVGAKRNFVLPLQLSKALANFAQSRGMTLYMVMLAGFQAVLHRYTGQDDICIGSPVAGRSHPQLENLIGLFLNTLVLRAKFDNDQSFDDLLAQVKEKVVGALDHQDVPFERVVDALQPNRDLGHTPLFQAMFILQSQPRWPMYPGELSLRTIPADGGGSKFDLTMSFSEDDEALHGEIEYDTDLFNPDTIERLIEHYIRLLDEAIAAPHQRINEIPLIDRAEQKHLRRLGCVPAQATITEMGPFTHEWFTKVAEVEPDRIALTQAGVHVTYHDLNVLANRLAHYLISLGVGTETPVGICLRPGVDLVVGLLGILKAGAAFVPLDPDYPADRLNYMLDTAAATYLLTNSQLADRLSSSVATTICLDVDQINIERFPGEAPNLQIDQHHLAYIIYTSGSTGKPKGVQISHGALVQFLRAMPDELGLTRDDVVAGITTLSFDPSLLELFGFLTRGARVALIDHLERQDGHALRKRLVEQQVTVLQATPSMWQLLIDAGWQGESLKLALVGGERLTESLAAKLLQHGVEVWNIYGPTETTVWSSIGRVSVADLSGRITIGKPMGAMRYFILDEALNPVPIGVVGEIYIAGPGLGRGYQARPDLTAERYIPNPFSDTAGQRMYRTGDLARFGADGRIEFIGRLDHQIKIRGFRVELGEIEASLRRNADIKEAIVTVREDVLGDKRLVGYVIFDPAAFSSDSDAIARERRLTEIRSELNLMLPDYMVPTSILCLMQWPLTPNGKVDRSQLPEPPRERAGTETTFVMPHTENERRIATVFSKLLRVDRISRLDSFFDLGGHSLLVAQLAAELGSIYGVELSLKDIFLSPTVSGMASHIETLIARHDSAAMTEDERLQRLIDSLTDEEVDQLLSMHVRETSEPEVISL